MMQGRNNLSGADLLDRFRDRLRLPLIAAPMFLVSGVELVVAACRNGVIGSFPTVNCRETEQLDAWLTEIESRLQAHADAGGKRAAPVCPNLIVHRSNARLAQDLAVLARHRPEVVITSVGSPAPVLAPLHDAGALVFADVASIRHAERAVAAGADGLVLLTAGAGGQTGWLNPFVFVRAVRGFFDGPIVLAGGISDGHALRAAEALGCDLAYMGTKFIATRESMADERYKQMLVDSTADDILLTTAFTGLQTNMLRPSIEAAGLDPDNLPARGAIDIGKDIDVGARENRPKRWRDIWSGGHSASGVTDVLAVDDLVARTAVEYESAAARVKIHRESFGSD
ncbi:nitronate monooxygenase [Bradyrhizobium sp. ISRA443]|uniref:NAD(P)H-dependent flavin oxidoreductase n=1 Tax=unclassified Bradyrhizobium TaxID=2631580 RepID=UPI00247929E9|nr:MULTISPECIES: nitronate monooxygenase [unclassified Bradyrhizobium]WGR95328.1 nitronate monooxygenase [Bradyrhizobium sp. ISRA435]WGS00312.1 nitronate monooxygenase [Bradyrhizobium sp. ISRA436]WGS07201.1 nitronate monooxygenase [Bradyrhizobium sp. ISRA437]WGS14086.1 nitronate monooxygenase [Bradyrhizobium sp. ISRA443]